MSGISNILASFGNRIGGSLLPSVYMQNTGMTPEDQQAAQQAALRQFGLGLLSNIGSGKGFGYGLGRAMDFASGSGADAVSRFTQNSRVADAQKEHQAAIDQAKAQRAMEQARAASQYVTQSQTPKDDLQRLGLSVPALGRQLAGVDVSTMSDDQARSFAGQLAEGFGSQLGKGPEDPKFSSVDGALIQTNAQGGPKAVYTAPEKFTGEPQAMTVGGKPVMARVGTHGTVQVVPGAAPYNKPGAGGADAGLDDPNTMSWRDTVLAGNATMQQVPNKYRTPVSRLLSSAPAGAYSPLAARRFTLAANDLTKNFLALPQYQMTANGLPYLQRIDAAMKSPGSVSDQDLLDSLTKLNTAGNAITDAQVKLITEGKSFADTMDTFKNKFANGGVLSDNQRQQIQKIAKGIYANYQKGYKPVYDAATYKLKTSGIPEAFWGIPDLNNLSAQIDNGAYAMPGDAPPAGAAPAASGWTVTKVP